MWLWSTRIALQYYQRFCIFGRAFPAAGVHLSACVLWLVIGTRWLHWPAASSSSAGGSGGGGGGFSGGGDYWPAGIVPKAKQIMVTNGIARLDITHAKRVPVAFYLFSNRLSRKNPGTNYGTCSSIDWRYKYKHLEQRLLFFTRRLSIHSTHSIDTEEALQS